MWASNCSTNFRSSPLNSAQKMNKDFILQKRFGMGCLNWPDRGHRVCEVKASTVDSSESSSGFGQRMERAWLISKVKLICSFKRKKESTRKYTDTLKSQRRRWRMGKPFCTSKKTPKSNKIKEQPSPVVCSSCNSNGHIECKWCNGTGFFIIGDNMLCEVQSKNTSCIICNAEGSMRCSDCKGTGFRAKWLDEPPIPN